MTKNPVCPECREPFDHLEDAVSVFADYFHPRCAGPLLEHLQLEVDRLARRLRDVEDLATR